MELIGIESGRAIVALEASDCATLARICQAADAHLERQETQPLANAARTYGAALRAFALGAVGVGHVTTAAKRDLCDDLAGLGLGDLVTLAEAERGG